MLSEVSKVIKEIPELTHIGNPVLRQRCEDVSLAQGKEIAQKLIKALDMYRSLTGIGAGLAAPQIGLAKKVFVTTGQSGYEIYINPEITEYSKKTCFYRESCLSSRMMWGDVERSESIEMKWLDADGKEHQENRSDFKARLLQHEYDHILGICSLDRAVPGTIEYSGDVKGEKMREEGIGI